VPSISYHLAASAFNSDASAVPPIQMPPGGAKNHRKKSFRFDPGAALCISRSDVFQQLMLGFSQNVPLKASISPPHTHIHTQCQPSSVGKKNDSLDIEINHFATAACFSMGLRNA